MLPVVSRLVACGHAVVWYSGRNYQSKIEATGARFAPFQEAIDFDALGADAALPERRKLKGLAQLRYDLIHAFMGQIGPMHRDLQAILRTFPADVVVADPTILAAQTLGEASGIPSAIFSITCLGMASRDVAPFGLGLPPSATFLGRLRNRTLHALLSNVLFRPVAQELRRQRHALGLDSGAFAMFATSPYLILQPTVEALEYPRSDLPPQVHFIGALLPDAPASFTPPAWWSEVTSRRRPVVLVTQGTVATDARELVAPTLAALAHEDVLVVAAGVDDAATLGRIPANARVEAFVPFKPLLPYVDAYVTNGGYGGAHFALANGVPIVIGGTTEDKPEIAARVAYSGAGINLKTATPTPARVHTAVRRVLQDPAYRTRAQQIQANLAQHNAPAEAAALLEHLACTRQPVLRVHLERLREITLTLTI
jgi:MGT family glycosyltransferase